MQPIDSPIYLLVPNEANERILHPGKIVETNAEEFVAAFDRAIAPAPGTDVNVFFEHNGKFMQQGATIIAVHEPTPAPAPAEVESDETESAQCVSDESTDCDAVETVPAQTVAIRCVGQPVSAESRGSYRVSVLGLQLFARIDKERNCQFVDVSPEGFAVMTTKNHRLGMLLPVAFEFDGEQLEGRIRVQTVRQLPSGKFRCGMLMPNVENQLRAALQNLTAAAQRFQLRRIRNSA